MHMQRRVILTYMPLATTSVLLTSAFYPSLSLRTRIIIGYLTYILATMAVPAVR